MLVSLATRNQCEQLDAFYKNKPGPLRPPFIFGVANGANENSAAFWCKRKEKDGSIVPVLMFMVIDNDWIIHKAGELEWINHAKGLSVYFVAGTLKGFNKLSNEQQANMPKDKRFEGRGVTSSYDGVGETLVMHIGEWWVRQLH